MTAMKLGYVSGNVHKLRDVEVPEKYYNRITTGVPLLDEIFGGQDMPGILPGATVLFTGFPGAGKSTMSLQLADLMSRHTGHKILFNVGEENEYMVKMRANRLELQADFNISQFSELDDLLAHVLESGTDILFQDSIQTLTYGDRNGQGLIRDVGNRMVRFANDHGITIVLVGHITKGGTFAGPMVLKHAVDVHARLDINRDTGNRVFELTKNRFGPGNMPYEFPMTAHGIDFRLIENAEEAVSRISSARKKDDFVEKAKELLLQGEKLSGYSYNEHNGVVEWITSEWSGNCSGNFWRDVLSRAEADLKKNNVIVGFETLNRRRHVYVECN